METDSKGLPPTRTSSPVFPVFQVGALLAGDGEDEYLLAGLPDNG